MTTHIMLDLETWGKRPGCDIRSIGAVAGTVSDDSRLARAWTICKCYERLGLVRLA